MITTTFMKQNAHFLYRHILSFASPYNNSPQLCSITRKRRVIQYYYVSLCFRALLNSNVRFIWSIALFSSLHSLYTSSIPACFNVYDNFLLCSAFYNPVTAAYFYHIRKIKRGENFSVCEKLEKFNLLSLSGKYLSKKTSWKVKQFQKKT